MRAAKRCGARECVSTGFTFVCDLPAGHDDDPDEQAHMAYGVENTVAWMWGDDEPTTSGDVKVARDLDPLKIAGADR